MLGQEPVELERLRTGKNRRGRNSCWIPFPANLLESSRQKLPEAHRVFDNAEGWFEFVGARDSTTFCAADLYDLGEVWVLEIGFQTGRREGGWQTAECAMVTG